MKYFLLFIITIALTSCSVQQEATAAKNKSGDLIGVANKESFNQAPYNSWFTQKFDSYKPDATTVSSLEVALKNVTIRGFMGTWCGDSRRETPHFYKILEAVNFNFKNLEL